MDPSRRSDPNGSSSTAGVKEQDFLSKLERPAFDQNTKSQVDCSLRLGLPLYHSSTAQTNLSISNDIHRAPTQSGQYYCNSSTGAGRSNTSFGSYGNPPPVIYNNYGNLYYMNPQNNVVVQNGMISNPRTGPALKKCMLCETTETPLWRKGPDGEKSLCNACGIRYRKGERKRMESTN